MNCTTTKYLRILIFITLPFIFMMASCEEELIGVEKPNTPTNNFEDFWKTFDTHYGLFEVKGVDWKKVHDEFRPRVSDQMADGELYNVLTAMMVLLNDNHLNLYPTNGALPVFPGGVLRYKNGNLSILKVQEDYSFDVVKKYAESMIELSPNMRYGVLAGNIGYLNFSGTDSRHAVGKNMDKILTDLRDTRSLIVDIRGNYGGMDAISQYVASCFAGQRKLYMKTRKRNGPSHDAFTDVTEWYVSPVGDHPYLKPIVVLTSRFTQSAGETFALAMNELDHVTLMGDTTAGSFSDNPNFEMLNGWMFSVSVGDYRASNGQSYEGTGIPPDVLVVTRKDDLLAGKDVALEKAIEWSSR